MYSVADEERKFRALELVRNGIPGQLSGLGYPSLAGSLLSPNSKPPSPDTALAWLIAHADGLSKNHIYSVYTPKFQIKTEDEIKAILSENGYGDTNAFEDIMQLLQDSTWPGSYVSGDKGRNLVESDGRQEGFKALCGPAHAP